MNTSDAESTPLDGRVADVVMIGGGIMSATLGSMLAVLQPDWRVVVVERAPALAAESSGAWNNAGTGHSGFCELNYMPDPADGRKASSIARQFHQSRKWWAHLVRAGLLDPTTFIHGAPHMDVVFGERDIDDLRRRFTTLSGDPLFDGLEYSEDHAEIGGWSPLTMEGRAPDERIAATRHPDGTDVDFGALTEGLARVVTGAGGRILLEHEVRSLRRSSDGTWVARGKIVGGQAGGAKSGDAGSGGATSGGAESGDAASDGAESGDAGACGPVVGGRFEVRGRHVFVGAGGMALRLLQRARIPEVRGYAVLPVGAAFLRCSVPGVVGRHEVKVYGQADIGAPPMSVPHLDRRFVDGREHLMFGPYATFSTKLLKHGRFTDFFTTLRWHNLHVIAAALVQNLPLMRYLIGELASSRAKRVAKLRRFY
ncbi:MAG: malate:quinone oxidoreductase, partial [Pseudoclavibacter sp.]